MVGDGLRSAVRHCAIANKEILLAKHPSGFSGFVGGKATAFTMNCTYKPAIAGFHGRLSFSSVREFAIAGNFGH